MKYITTLITREFKINTLNILSLVYVTDMEDPVENSKEKLVFTINIILKWHLNV